MLRMLPLVIGGWCASAASASVWITDSPAAWLSRVDNSLVAATFSEPIWPFQQPLGGPWTLNGVTYEGFAGTPFPNIYVYGNSPLSGLALTANGDEDIELRLTPHRTAAAFDVAVNQFGPVVIRVFGPDGEEMGSTSIPPSTIGFFGVVSSRPIETLRFTSVRGAVENSYLDNVVLADNACPADFNQDGIVDFFDYLDFVAAFDAGDPSADVNGDTQADFFDYLDFVQAFDAGCD